MNVKERKPRGRIKPIVSGQSVKSFTDELLHLRKKKLFRSLTCLEPHNGSFIHIRDQRYVNFSSNNYLDLSGHPDIIHAAVTSLNKYGLGSGASRLLSGTLIPHKRLEEKIASFKSTEAALVFNSGYAANTGIIPALAEERSVIFSDELNHASIIDGTRLSGRNVVIYRHRDVCHLETLLKKSAKKKNISSRLVISDTVFSMDGDIAPLPDLVSLCKVYGAMLMIDDAHATGVIGKKGRGGLEHFRIDPSEIIQMGTLSKAVGSFGGYVAGRQDLVDLLINRARSFMYSTSLPAAIAAAGTKGLDIIEKRSKQRLKRLWSNAHKLMRGLRNAGFDTLGSETPIIPIMTGDIDCTMKLARHLLDCGIFAPAIRPPSVPDGKCRIRFSVTAGHTNDDIERVLDSVKSFRKKMSVMHKKKS